MKKIIFAVAVLFLLAGFSVLSNPDSNKMSAFSWLLGSWTMKKSNGGALMETWVQRNDSTFSGEGLSISMTGRSTVKEKLQLVYRSGKYYYITTVADQNNNQPVKFALTSHSDKGFVAENPEHDFPKRIMYNLIGRDSIHAVIDGGPSLPDKKTSFYFTRYKN